MPIACKATMKGTSLVTKPGGVLKKKLQMGCALVRNGSIKHAIPNTNREAVLVDMQLL
jgi:hypothetical protein